MTDATKQLIRKDIGRIDEWLNDAEMLQRGEPGMSGWAKAYGKLAGALMILQVDMQIMLDFDRYSDPAYIRATLAENETTTAVTVA